MVILLITLPHDAWRNVICVSKLLQLPQGKSETRATNETNYSGIIECWQKAGNKVILW